MSNAMSILLESSLRVCLLVTLTAGIVRIAGRRVPGLRDAAWRSACLAMLAFPILLLPTIRLDLRFDAPLPAFREGGAVISSPSSPKADAPWDSVRYRRHADRGGEWLIAIWASGAFAVVAWTLGGLFIARRIVVRSASAAHDLRARYDDIVGDDAISVKIAREIRSPVSIRMRRGVILLPLSATEWTHSSLRAAIAHEVAHIRRHDTWWMAAASLNCAIFWFHPLAWLIRSRLRFSAELAADGHAASQVGRIEYAHMLAASAASSGPHSGLQFAMAPPSMLRQRVDSVLTIRQQPPRLRSWLVVVAIIFMTMALSVRARIASPLESDPRGRALLSALTSDDPQTRADGLHKLARWQGREHQVLEILLAHLGDPAPIARVPQWDFHREGWQPAMSSFHHPSTGEAAALGLASFGSFAAPALESKLDSASTTERRNAAWAIGEIRHPRELSSGAVPKLIELLDDPDASVRAAAAWTLGDLGAEQSLPALRRMVRAETDRRAHAIARRSVQALEAGITLEHFRATGR